MVYLYIYIYICYFLVSNAKEEIGQNDLSSSIINNCSDNNLSEIMLDKSMKISSNY